MASGRARKGMQRRSGAPGECHLRGRSLRKKLPAALPLVHATVAFSANEILRSGKLEPDIVRFLNVICSIFLL